jgi:hypothetical protein
MALEGVALADEQERRSTGQAVLVTDLSRDLINYLGGTLQITPDSLEEHLVCSGYSPYGHYDPDPRLWHSELFLRITSPSNGTVLYISQGTGRNAVRNGLPSSQRKVRFTHLWGGQLLQQTSSAERGPDLSFADHRGTAPWEERITFTWEQLNGKRTRMFRLPETISSLIPSANNMNRLCSLRTLSRGWCFPRGPDSPQRPYLTHAVRCERRHWA